MAPQRIQKLVSLVGRLWYAEFFLYLLSVEHVVDAEGYDSVVWSHVVDNAVVCSFDVECVWVHECHAANQ